MAHELGEIDVQEGWPTKTDRGQINLHGRPTSHGFPTEGGDLCVWNADGHVTEVELWRLYSQDGQLSVRVGSNGTQAGESIWTVDDATLLMQIHNALDMDDVLTENIGTPFPDTDTTPSVADGNIFKCGAQAAPIAITALDGGTTGQIIRIQAIDADTTMTNGGTLKLQGNWVPVANQTITLYYDGSNHYELGRSGGGVVLLLAAGTTFPNGDTTPSVVDGNYFLCGTTAAAITAFDDGVKDQVIHVEAVGTLTTIAASASLLMADYWAPTAGDIISFYNDGTNWNELSRSRNQGSGQPTVTANLSILNNGGGSGGAAVLKSGGGDLGGFITITIGTGGTPSSGKMCDVDFAAPFGIAPRSVVLSNGNISVADDAPYVLDTSITTTGFDIHIGNTPSDGEVLKLHYQVKE